MRLRTHEQCERLAAKACHGHAHGRSIADITADDVTQARLYSYAFRGQVIGAFHAAQIALDECAPQSTSQWRQDAGTALADLRAVSLEAIPTDFRAVLVPFHRYVVLIERTLLALQRDLDCTRDPRIEMIRDRFVTAVERVTASNGIVPVRDDLLPEQGSFIVPSLGITIVPLVYGDTHSWNLASLSGQAADVPRHQHAHGVEIHLGYGSLCGQTLLGACRTSVTEGYAMAIPPGTPHGFTNQGGHDHLLPFIFGSKRLGGWGIVPDVEPQPCDLEKLALVPFEDPGMNKLVLLDRAIEQTKAGAVSGRRVLIHPLSTFRPESGGLELAITRATADGFRYPRASYRILAIASGRGRVTLNGRELEVSAHDHVGIPSGVDADVRQVGDASLVVLDSLLVEALEPNFAS